MKFGHEAEIRHGELSFFRLPPAGPDLAKYTKATDLVLGGSHDSAHVLHGACQQLVVDARVRRIVVAAPTKVTHQLRHLSETVPPGHYAIVTARTADGLVED